MQVSCGHCGTNYDFDAAAVPAGGYEARCTQCQQTFFVAQRSPDEGVSPLADLDLASITTGAFRLGSGEVDLQLQRPEALLATGEFQLAEPDQATDPAGPTAELDLAASGPTPALQRDLAPSPAPSPWSAGPLQTPATAPASTRPASTAELPPLPDLTSAAGAAALAALSAELQLSSLGHLEKTVPQFRPPASPSAAVVAAATAAATPASVAAAPPARSAATDLPEAPLAGLATREVVDPLGIHRVAAAPSGEPATRLRRLGRWPMLAVPLLILALLALSQYRAWLAAQAAQATQAAQSVAVDAGTRTLIDAGRLAMLPDTAAALAAAGDQFATAAARCSGCAEVSAWQIALDCLRAVDALEEGAAEHARAQGLRALLAGLAQPQDNAVAVPLRAQLAAAQAASVEASERGGAALVRAARVLTDAQRRARGSAVTVAVALLAAYHPGRPASVVVAALAAAQPIATGALAATALPLAQAHWARVQGQGVAAVTAILQPALEQVPGLQRARWELAQAHLAAGDPGAAAQVLQQLLSAVPGHARAQALRAQLLASAEEGKAAAGKGPGSPPVAGRAPRSRLAPRSRPAPRQRRP